MLEDEKIKCAFCEKETSLSDGALTLIIPEKFGKILYCSMQCLNASNKKEKNDREKGGINER